MFARRAEQRSEKINITFTPSSLKFWKQRVGKFIVSLQVKGKRRKKKHEPPVRNQIVDKQNTTKWNFTKNDVFFKVHIYRTQEERNKLKNPLKSLLI